jgi:hypothetical protein
MQGMIIALQGPGNSGKSHVIRRVYDTLIQNGWKSIQPKYQEVRRDGRVVEGPVVGPRGREVKGAVLENQDCCRIGIVSLGDYPVHLDNILMPLLRDYDCAAYVCAIRTDGGTAKKLAELVTQHKPEYAIKLFPKNIEDESHHARVDNDVANAIIQLITTKVTSCRTA